MTNGYETRQVVEGAPSPNAAANQPARQLSGVGVQAPRGGDVSQVGAAQRVLADALTMGGKALAPFIERQVNEDKLKGEMLYAEGKTEAELAKQGVSRHTLEGYKALKAKTAANEWFAHQSASLDTEWADKPTAQYRDYLHTQFQGLMDTVDPADSDTANLITAMADDMLPKLVAQHTMKNTQFMAGESVKSFTNLVLSEAKTGNKDSLGEVLTNAERFLPNASKEVVRTAVFSAVKQGLEDGDFTVFDQMGGVDGIRAYGADENQLASIDAAVKKGKAVQEERLAPQLHTAENDIYADVKNTGDLASGYEKLSQLQAANRLPDSWVATKRGELQAAKNEFDTTMEKWGKASDLIANNFAGADIATPEVRSMAFSKQLSTIVRAVNADQAWQKDGAGNIISQDARDTEAQKRYVKWLVKIPSVDTDLKNKIAAAGQGNPLDNGVIRPEVLTAFTTVRAMRDAGMSEAKIKEYAGSTYDMLSTAVSLGNGSNNPKVALATAYDMMENKGQRMQPIADTGTLKAQWPIMKQKVMDDIEPWKLGSTGDPKSSDYDTVISYQIKQAAKKSSDMDAWMTKRIDTIAQMYPKMSTESVMKLAQRDMSQWEYVMGNMMGPDSAGNTVTQRMGLGDVEGYLVPNAAIIAYLAQPEHSAVLFDGQQEITDPTQHLYNSAKSWSELTSDIVDSLVYEPSKVSDLYASDPKLKAEMQAVMGAYDAGKVKFGTLMFNERAQALLNKVREMDIQDIGNGQMLMQRYVDGDRMRPIGDPVILDMKQVGDWYKGKRKQAVEKSMYKAPKQEMK